MSDSDSVVVAERPTTGTPRAYDFPRVDRTTLSNGIRVAVAAMPGRQLISATLVTRFGAADEPQRIAGALVMAARAFTEGTESRDAIELTEAAERLGASIHAEAGWDAVSISVDVPAARFEAALELLAEIARQPTFPDAEIERLRDERLNDLLQAKADPRRRAEEAFVATIYDGASPYRRPAGGTKDTVERLDRDAIVEVVGMALDPGRMSLIVGGDIDVAMVVPAAERLFGDWQAAGAARIRRPEDASAVGKRFVKVVHRPGAVQTEIRIGHPGVPRNNPDFHALSVMGAILGGLFNSRLNMSFLRRRDDAGGQFDGGLAGRRAAGWSRNRDDGGEGAGGLHAEGIGDPVGDRSGRAAEPGDRDEGDDAGDRVQCVGALARDGDHGDGDSGGVQQGHRATRWDRHLIQGFPPAVRHALCALRAAPRPDQSSNG